MTTTPYQVIARKYRPQTFKEVLGQSAIVTTLKNAIKFNRTAHAYLFCGSRGTGKTTLARIFAKALNCLSPSEDFEPCNACSSCKAIASGSALDVIEIDGASNRGIDDIRQINETVGYSSSSGKYRIYIIDEVHMLTKEAFNALLKTLEEPPPKAKFFLATTEPHKVLPTILSRCQRFNLNRIPNDTIEKKLAMIAQDLKIEVEEEVYRIIAKMADGGLRDAESLFDQMIAFHEEKITASSVSAILGLMPRDCYFELDKAGKDGDLSKAFDIAHQVFSQGKDLTHFLEGLTEHFRTLLLMKVASKDASLLTLPPQDRIKYEASAKMYSQEQCLTNLDFLIESMNNIRFMPSGRIALEAILLRILRSHQRLPIDFLIRRLSELEQSMSAAAPIPVPAPAPVEKSLSLPKPSSMTEDPTPTPADLGIKQTVPAPIELGARQPEETRQAIAKKQGQYDTLMHFAAVELEGTIQKNHLGRK